MPRADVRNPTRKTSVATPSMAFSGEQNDKVCVDRFALQLSLGVVDITTDIFVVVLAYYTTRGVKITVR